MGTLKDMILFIYTLILFVLHAAGFYQSFYDEFFTSAGFQYHQMVGYLMIITAIQYLDIPFSFFLTRSNPVVVFMQVSGRMFVLWVASHMSGWHCARFTLVAVYLLSELCRGPYYLATCLKTPNRHLTWIRYNAFKVLYPVGFSCEALVFLNYWFVAKKTTIDYRNPQFLAAIPFTVFFLSIVTYLFRSMSRKAAKKNAELEKLAKIH
ncbi:hypothetical protein B9Z55_011532 [Caenorhabditis nigoni]|uniref:Very-long-chain (3R)-3-hydroxyacyl-CoA dehydratase n=1 Tax=Caenorhabditis nigoni TaxID=1611254 RepID=A0A2G5UKL2_9PELO|nr:hypothetical protein B9Z55_011532 [Caenorhabditis nigoni]